MKNKFIETGDYLGWRYQPYLSMIIFLFSCILFTIFLNYEHFYLAFSSVLSSSLLAFFMVGVPKFFEFKKIARDILHYGVYKRKRLVTQVIFETLLMFALILFPLILHLFVSSIIWFNTFIGVIIGISGFQLLFSSKIRFWEKKHGIDLERFVIKIYNSEEGEMILESGVRIKRK